MTSKRLALLIGKRSYPIVTSREEEVQRAADLLRSVVESLDSSLSQDEMLFLAAMTLSGELIRVEDRLRELAGGEEIP
ncbi:cell division protein ZapA [Thermanaerovibrio acidaminovorans]|jgi:hypothetical protein|uniref:Cell division protein ZapA n=1 Tax=Thermanaerovibrio acidaminovorans (strain ATCC 49978 / DSM 6589 / Su883) TaxID=525903 RepID=D1B9L2_THEAS|nr:cell division protein ZapA [Thermanaerovibrio acidaminovorans]ACZ18965.1 hypothetical protein Taci_0732 [Thermanaerovibrio acidaminovorans DSM 6589]